MMTNPSDESTLLEYVIQVDKLTGVHSLVQKESAWLAWLESGGSGSKSVFVMIYAPFGFRMRPFFRTKPTPASLCCFDFVPFEAPTKAIRCPILVRPVAHKDGVTDLIFQVMKHNGEMYCFTLKGHSASVDVILDLELCSDSKPINFDRLRLRQVHHTEKGQSVHLHLFFSMDGVESASEETITLKDVELVSAHGDCTYETACVALRATDGDIVEAILRLTNSTFGTYKASSSSIGKQDVPDASKHVSITEPLQVPHPEQQDQNQIANLTKDALIDSHILDSSDEEDEDESDSDDDDDSSEDGSLVPAREFLKDFIFTVYTRVLQFKHVHSLGLVGDNEADASKWDIFTRCVAEDFDVEEEDGNARCYRMYLQQFDMVPFFNTWCSQNNVTLPMLVFAEEFALRLCTHPIAGMFVSRVRGEGVFEAPSRQIAEAFEKLLAVHPSFCSGK